MRLIAASFVLGLSLPTLALPMVIASNLSSPPYDLSSNIVFDPYLVAQAFSTLPAQGSLLPIALRSDRSPLTLASHAHYWVVADVAALDFYEYGMSVAVDSTR